MDIEEDKELMMMRLETLKSKHFISHLILHPLYSIFHVCVKIPYHSD